MQDAFPVLPFRSDVYGPDELFAGFDPADPESYARTPDFRAYRSTKLPPSREVGMLRALHDQSITDARDDVLVGRRVVAIMGGHALGRDEPAYAEVAGLARSLSRTGFLVVSGGGPGAMEATHLGALLAGEPDDALGRALGVLGTQPAFPEGTPLVAAGGEVDHGALRALHAWQVPAFEVLASLPSAGRGMSLAVPTWFYGQEPPTPFASHLAKYFSNSLREDGLLAIAGDGVVYAKGGPGTVQEVFQDAAQNAYRTVRDRFSPMAFLDTDGCWSATLPVEPLLEQLFTPDDFAAHVRVSPDAAALFSFLSGA